MSTLPPQSAKSFFSAVTYPSVTFQPYAPTSVVVPASGAYAVTNDNANITTYPPEDDKKEHTYASYGEDPSIHIFKLSPNNPDSWTLSLSISTPTKLSKPVLRSITYIIKYATTHDDGNSTVQADVVLTSATCPVGILSKSTDLGVYRNGPGYEPRMVDSAKALCLSSASAIKCNGGTPQWSHYIDHRRLLPNVQLVGSAHLYLNFHVFEYPTAETRRYLAIEVSATWCDISEVTDDEDSGVDEVAMLAAVKTKEKGKNVPAPPNVSPPSRIVSASPPTTISPSRIVNSPPPTVTVPPPSVSAPPPTVSAAPKVADQGMQDLIKAKLSEYPSQNCPQGYGWKKTDTGYVCEGGTHYITFAQLGMKS